MKLSELFSKLKEEEEQGEANPNRPVYYLQTQNGNLSEGEYAPLLDDVGLEGPSWVREAFGESSLASTSFPPRFRTILIVKVSSILQINLPT
jgi:hypothetical protein